MQQIAYPPGAADTDLPKAKSATEAEADKVPWKEKNGNPNQKMYDLSGRSERPQKAFDSGKQQLRLGIRV